jgi:glycosyltransferase involved in cell wall biosynthesis
VHNQHLQGGVIVSILISAYNVQDYIEEALDSVISQSFEYWECIVIDDGSTDGTSEIIRRYTELDDRFIPLKNITNLGITNSLNLGLPIARGQFIARFDADDVMLPTRIERLLRFLEERPEIDLVGSDTITIDAEGRPVRRTYQISWEPLIYLSMRYFNPVLHCWLCRKTFYEKLDGYRSVSGAEDFDIIVRGWIIGARYANLPEPLIKIRRHSSNISRLQASNQSSSMQFVTKQARGRRVNPVLQQTEANSFLPVNEKWIAANSIFDKLLLLAFNPSSPVMKELLARKSFQCIEFVFRMLSARGTK